MIFYDELVRLLVQNGLKKSKKLLSIFLRQKYAFAIKNVKKQLFLISLFVFNILLHRCVCGR